MIRLRFGQNWRRESKQAVDSVALTLHGVDLLVGANEENLADVVNAWSFAWQVLGSQGGELAQVSLPESRLELVVRRVSPAGLQLQVVSLARPARLTRPPVHVDALELRKAWIAGVSALWRDLQQNGEPQVTDGVLQALERVRQVAPPLPGNETRGPGFGYRWLAREPFELGFELWDEEERLLAHRSGGPAPLGSLLVPGSVSLRLAERLVNYHPESVFLFALEVSRQAQELLAADRSGVGSLELAGTGPSLPLEAGGELERAMFQLGIELARVVEVRNGAQRENPYLRDLVERCQGGLRSLKVRVPAPRREPMHSPPDRTSRTQRPLEEHGRLRRLKFVQRFEARIAAPEAAIQVLPVPGGSVWVSASQWAERYRANGALSVRHESEHGVAVSRSDWAIVSQGKRLLGHRAQTKNARWLRPHDGLPLGPSLNDEGLLMVTQSETRAAIAFWTLTGREAWRFSPFRPAHIHVATFGSCTLVATDAGDLFGLSSLDGQIRYRFEAPLPFVTAPRLLGSSFVALLNTGEHSALVCAELDSGQLRWTHEFGWSRPSAPVVAGGRVWLAGHQNAGGFLAALNPDGKPRFEIPLPFSDDAYFLVPMGRSVLVAGPHGAAARYSAKGELEYSVPPAAEAAWRKLSPRVSRGVVLLPGDPLRALDAKSGTVLAELRGGPALLALEADHRLNIFTLDEGGALKAFRLISHFSVV